MNLATIHQDKRIYGIIAIMHVFVQHTTDVPSINNRFMVELSKITSSGEVEGFLTISNKF